MFSDKLLAALNDQMTFEFYSGYIYKAMAAYFRPLDLNGFANWLEIQTLEEMTHGERFYLYINDSGGRVHLGAIDEPKFDYSSSLEVFETALHHEELVTGRINKLADMALAESDHATRIFLDWFVTEQIEEEANVGGIVAKLNLIGDDRPALLLLDQSLAARAFNPPAPGTLSITGG